MQRLLMGLALAGVLIMTAGLMWLSSRVEWTTLYSNMDARDAQQAAAELVAEKIPSQLDSDGTTLRVPVNMVDKARLGLAAKGLPQSGRIGFELFDKPNWVGSEFDEKVNYQRALEGELARRGYMRQPGEALTTWLQQVSEEPALSALKEPLREKATLALLIGAAAGKIEKQIAGSVAIERVDTLERAMETASHVARPGDVVLLAPACASFDQFQNYEHRGRVFKDLVRRLEQHGVVATAVKSAPTASGRP